MSQSLQDLIAGTSELRSLPSTTMRLMRLLDDATVGASEVLDIIEKDPSLTANLLKLCNSAYFGVRRQVGTAREALVLLGNQVIINLAFATSMGDILRGPLRAYRLERNQLWHHALGTALGASFLASRQADVSLRERAFTAGLVHDIGKLLLNRALGRHLEQLPVGVDAADLMAAEVKILGFDHAAAGAALGEAWNFPTTLVQVIGAHHDDAQSVAGAAEAMSESARGLCRAVAGANLVAACCGFGGGVATPGREETEAALAELGFAAELTAELLEQLPGDLDGMLAVIGEHR